MTADLDLFDFFVFCAGLVAIMWIGLHSSRQKPAKALSRAAVIGMIVWFAALGVAFHLIFG
jgi:RsiW-degrading membrane proteinase PrsW (M82 family)